MYIKAISFIFLIQCDVCVLVMMNMEIYAIYMIPVIHSMWMRLLNIKLLSEFIWTIFAYIICMHLRMFLLVHRNHHLMNG